MTINFEPATPPPSINFEPAEQPYVSPTDKAKAAISIGGGNAAPEGISPSRLGSGAVGAGTAFIDSVVEGRRRAMAGLGQLMSYGATPYDPRLAVSNYLFGTPKENKNAGEAFNTKYADLPAAQGVATLSEVAPFLVGGPTSGARAALANAPKVLRGIADTRLAKGVADVVGLGAKNAAYGGALSAASYDPTYQQTIGEKIAPGAIIGGALGAGTGLVRAVSPHRIFGRGLDKAEIATINEALGDLPTPLGAAVNAPGLKRFQENYLARIPGSGTYAKYLETNKRLEDEGEALLSDMLGSHKGEDPQKLIRDTLVKNKEEIRTIKNENYKEADALAENAGVRVSPNTYQKTAQKLLADNATKDFSEFGTPQLESILQKAATEKPAQSFHDIGIVRGKINAAIKEASRAGKDYEVRIYKDLKTALDTDKQAAIDAVKQPEIKDKFAAAQEYYAKEYAPYKDADIASFLSGGKDTDLLANYFVRTGKNDRVQLASKLLDKIPEEQKKLLAYQLFAKSMKPAPGTGSIKFNPQTFDTTYRDIPPKVRDKLFSDKTLKDAMEKYALRVEHNKEGLNVMTNPLTGQRNAEAIMTFLGGLGLGGAGVGYAMGDNRFSPWLSSIAASMAGARGVNKLLTSPKIRNKIMTKMAHGYTPQPWKSKALGVATPLIQGLGSGGE